MSAQHTPGPWLVSGSNIRPVVGHRIAVMDSQPDERANARLIAAAPELLAAVKQARILIEAEGIAAPSTLAAINAAIAKATGGDA